jgi:peptide/nickel transport system ATP-binding protein
LAIEALTVALPPGADRPLALRNVSLRLAPGEILCVVGESGSGKSVMATAVMGLLAPGLRIVSGRILLSGTDLASLSEEGLRRVRGRRVAMVFQEPMTALNPLMTVGAQLAEMWRTHTDLAGAEIAARSLEALREVALPDPEGALRAFPHELSGGQRQRAMIAMALALEPEALICDEPTTALDVTTQAQVLALVRDLQRRRGTAVLFITHDFGVVAEIADRVAVMQRGVLVEEGPVSRVLTAPAHDYTRRLLAAVPPLRAPAARPLDGRRGGAGGARPSKTYGAAGLFRSGRRATRALDDVSVTLRRGATLGVVGESGSGKSTLARCVVGLLAADGGEIRVAGAPLPRARAEAAKLVQMVFQDPTPRSTRAGARASRWRRARSPRGGRARRLWRGRASCSRWWGSTPPRRRASRTSSAAGSASASASRAPSPCARRCWSRTSRCPRWTFRCRRRCWSCCAICGRGWASRPCSSPTTCAWRRRSATRWR